MCTFYLQTTFAKPKTQCDLGETIFGCYSEGYQYDAMLGMGGGGGIVIKAILVGLLCNVHQCVQNGSVATLREK